MITCWVQLLCLKQLQAIKEWLSKVMLEATHNAHS